VGMLLGSEGEMDIGYSKIHLLQYMMQSCSSSYGVQ